MALRVAWISPVDVESIRHRLNGEVEGEFHPATWIRNAIKALTEYTDIELHVISHDKRFPRDYRFIEKGVHYHLLHAPLPFIPRPIALYQLDRWKYYRELDAIKPDIVHGHGTENLFSYVAVTSGYPVVITIQAIIMHLFKQYRRISRRFFEHFIVQFFEYYTIRHSQHFIIKAPFAKEIIRKYRPDASVYLLENIIHERYFNVVRDPKVKKNKIVFIGTLINTKGVEELIKAFHLVCNEAHETELHIVGSGKTIYVETVLKPLAKQGVGEGRIIFHGQISAERIAEMFSQACMLVLPSYSDTSPNVVAEALVAGVPVIGTDVGGIPFMISHNETGLLVPVRNIDALADAMRKYLLEPELAELHAKRGQIEARKRYSEKRYVMELLKIYMSITGNDWMTSYKDKVVEEDN